MQNSFFPTYGALRGTTFFEADSPTQSANRQAPFLSVRHIVGPKVWDSYAKAAWIAKTLEQHEGVIDLKTIERMTGDSHGTIRRLLEGYYLVEQVKNSELFNFEDSKRKGRGTAAAFPFSWVYNALGYSNVRQWVGLDEGSLSRNPLKKGKLQNAADLMRFMFGQKLGKKDAAIKESRELGDLAKCLGQAPLIARLQNGESVEEVMWEAKKGIDKVMQSLASADKALVDAAGAVTELSRDDASRTQKDAERVAKRARGVYTAIVQRMTNIDDDLDQ